MTIATARAHPNIALVKYWGKRDEELNLPVAGSLSLTLDGFATTTTVNVTPRASSDRLELNGLVAGGESLQRVTDFLDLVRALAGSEHRATVFSHNEAPTAAGLASSASGFAALAAAAAKAYGLELDDDALSRLARRGSGSAARSIHSGVAIWHAGDGDETSFAEPIEAAEMHMVIVIVGDGPKAVSSREAMRRTKLTSPYFDAWIRTTTDTLSEMVAACGAGDFTRIGQITETHALRMHAVIQASDPPIRYLSPASIAVFDAVATLREEGIEAWATADAGPNVAVLVRPEDSDAVARVLTGFGSATAVGPGRGVELVPNSEGPVPVGAR